MLFAGFTECHVAVRAWQCHCSDWLASRRRRASGPPAPAAHSDSDSESDSLALAMLVADSG